MDDILNGVSKALNRLSDAVRSPVENVAPLLNLPPNQRLVAKYTALHYVESTEDTFLRVAELEKLLVNARAEFFRQRAHCQSCLVPISCLPDGVLRSIFSFAVVTVEDARSLSLVCRSWHAVATSQKSLWKKITFLTNGCDRLCGNSSVAFGPPTELMIRNRPDMSSDSPLVHQLGYNLVNCFIHAASYDTTPPEDPINAFQELLESGLPKLRLLDVVYHTNYSPFLSSVSVVGVLPSLRTLKLSGLELGWAVELPVLQQLHVERVTKEVLFSIISGAPALQELIVDNLQKSYMEIEPNPIIKAEVQVLVIKKAETDQLVDLFTELPLNNLRSLTIDAYIRGGPDPLPELDAETLTGSTHLSDVKLYGADHCIIGCMVLFPLSITRQLTHLAITPLCGGEYQSDVDASTPELQDWIAEILLDRSNGGGGPFENLTICDDLLGAGNRDSTVQELILFPRCRCGSATTACEAALVPVLIADEPAPSQ
ncbi:hypothetical protein DL93DRAFT_2076183 [Clavulina sp. PMI_390]|nr:hypothetical protein DL93DRAFT_2076183 [Clavulina sp. PMI_390]